MQAESWIALFHKIPVNLHDSLALILTTGSELVLQKIQVLEPEYAVLRARLAGTQDGGRVVVLPYHQILAIAFTRRMTEAEVESIFDGAPPSFAAGQTLSAGGAADESESLEDTTLNAQAGDVNTPSKPALPSKSVLLAKLRARLNEGPKPGP